VLVDYPPEECAEFAAALKAAGMDLIFLLAPTSTDERMQQVARWPAATCTTSRSRA
jgi:tryptophan synthase alpha chain